MILGKLKLKIEKISPLTRRAREIQTKDRRGREGVRLSVLHPLHVGRFAIVVSEEILEEFSIILVFIK